MPTINASKEITHYIEGLGDWRGKLLARVRAVILEASELTEEWKWNTPVWSHNGNVVAVGAFRDHIKINFFKGASLSDLTKMFNAGLDAKATRAIDIRKGDTLNDAGLKDLVRAAIALNVSKKKPSPKAR
jgi:hypothetical protein